MRPRIWLRVVIGVLVTLGVWANTTGAVSAQALRVVVRDQDGQRRAGLRARELPPQDPAKVRAGVAVFTLREDVLTHDGRVVNGLGFAAWMEGKAAVVVVLALVPRDGQRNIYRPEADLAERQIGKYRLGLGAKTIVKEAETMGLGRWTIETTDGSTAVAK